jgi:hypothetical protein
VLCDIGAKLDRPFRGLRGQSHHPLILHDQVGGIGSHTEVEAGIALALLGEKIEEIPLRHQRDKLADRRQMGEIGKVYFGAADHAAQPANLVMRNFEERVEQAELVHHLQG